MSQVTLVVLNNFCNIWFFFTFGRKMASCPGKKCHKYCATPFNVHTSKQEIYRKIFIDAEAKPKDLQWL